MPRTIEVRPSYLFFFQIRTELATLGPVQIYGRAYVCQLLCSFGGKKTVKQRLKET